MRPCYDPLAQGPNMDSGCKKDYVTVKVCLGALSMRLKPILSVIVYCVEKYGI